VDDDLVRSERETLLARIEHQDEALAALRRELVELRARAYRQSEELREAQIALRLLSRSRLYRLARFLGRWGWLERRIRRGLQSS
jgi:hypothetical protein